MAIDKKHKNWPKRIVYAGLGVFVLLVVLLLVGRLALRTDTGRAFIVSQVEALKPSGQTLNVEGLEGDVLGDFTIDRLEVSDADGVWMSAKNVGVRWSPFRLMKGHIDVQYLQADEADLIRSPSLVKSSGPAKFEIKRFDIGNAEFPLIRISENVLPDAQILQVQSSLSHSESGGSLSAKASTLGDMPLDQLVADVRWSPDFVITGDASVESLPGGVISTVLQLQADKPLTLEMKTSGRQQVLVTTINGQLGGQDFAEAELTLRAGVQEIAASFDPNFIPALEPYRAIFGGTIQANGTIDRSGETVEIAGTINARDLDVEAVAIKIDDGYDLPRLTVKSRAPLALFPGFPARADTAEFSGRATFTETLSLSGVTMAENIAYNDYKVTRLSGPLTLTIKDATAEFDADMTGAIASDSTLDRWSGQAPKIKAKGQYNVADKVIVLSQSVMRIPGVEASAKGRADIGQKQANLDGIFNVKKQALGVTLPADLSGKFAARSTASGPRVTFDGTAKNFSSYPEPPGTLLGDQATFKGSAILADGNTVRVSSFSLNGASVDIDAKGTRKSTGALDAVIAYNADSFSVSQIRVESTSGKAEVSGNVDALKFDITGQAPSVTFRERTLSNVSYGADGHKNGEAIKANVTLSGRDDVGPVTLETEVAYQNGQWDLQNIQSDIFGLSVSGGIGGEGSDMASLKSDLIIQGDPSQFIPAKSVDLSVNLANERAEISGTVSDINAGPIVDSALEITAQGPRDNVNFTLGLTGYTNFNDIRRKVDLALSGQGDLAGPYMSLSAALSGDVGQFPVKSSGPLTLRQTENGLAGDGRLMILDGAVSYDFNPENAALNVQGDDLSFARSLVLLGRAGLEGRVNFQGNVQAVAAGLNGKFDGNITSIRQPGSRVEPLDIDLTAVLQEGALTASASSLNQTFEGTANLAGLLETTTRPPFVKWPPTTALTGEAVAAGDIGTLAELFLPPETNAEGRADLNVAYSFPLEAEGMIGTMRVSEGEFEQGTIGLHLIDIAFQTQFEKNYIEVSGFTGKGQKGGQLTGGGRMALGGNENSGITLSAQNLRVFQRREGQADVSGDLEFTQTKDALKLSGDLVVDDAKVSLDNFPRAGRPTLDVDFAADSDDKTARVKHTTELDLKIKSDGRISLRGRGVNASMALQAAITGPFKAPRLSGEASIVRGRFDFLGKRFELKDSRVTFRDDVMKSPLDIKAVRDTREIKATVNVGGTLERPVIDLRSEPSLPEDEVLSYILFGRSASQLTTLETARMAAALAQLSGGGGFDLMGTLENSLGLDTLDFARTDTGKTQLATGKYLSNDVYVEVRSSTEGSPGLAVEWTPRKNIAVEAETAPGDTQRVSVQWQKDFD